ncbi:MAG: alpha/beta-type small acid-soluble spore protein [Eubacteriales bacterium]|nr:alpha/beta-type small acid-soluble spore protein [Eubacteriales bacterium]
MANNNSSSKKINVPEARAALEQFKYEVANEIGVPLKQGYNGDLTSAQNGYVGGYMVKKMIEAQERQMAGQNHTTK